MRKVFFALVGGVLMTGCVHTNYRLIVYNGTTGQIEDTKVTFKDGRSFGFGVMDPRIDKGMYPMVGPLGDEVSLEWVDSQGNRKTAKASISTRLREDSIICLINSNDTITVQTGRALYGPRRK